MAVFMFGFLSGILLLLVVKFYVIFVFLDISILSEFKIYILLREFYIYFA